MESILTSIKKLLGIAEDYEHFDSDIIIHINSVFMTLNQIGIGPESGFSINDKFKTWNDYVDISTNVDFNAIKTYIYLKVKLLFDPPMSSIVTESINRMISELEFRINLIAETKKTSGEEEGQNGKTRTNPSWC